MRRPAALLALALVLVAGGCGGGGETVEEASDAVASLIASDDCVRLTALSASVPLALGGAVSASAGAEAAYLAEFGARAPRELAGDVAVVQSALAALAGGQEVAAPQQEPVRAAAASLGAWARTSCPG